MHNFLDIFYYKQKCFVLFYLKLALQTPIVVAGAGQALWCRHD